MAIAHRGASSYAPENTVAAFDLALQMGVRHIELDVHSTRDDHLVVIHDDTVDRTTNGSGSVADHTLATLRALDAGAWFGAGFAGQRIPTLGEVFERYKGRTHFHVEIKGHPKGLAERTVDLVRTFGISEHVTMTSFQKARLEETRAYAADLPTGWLVPAVTDAVITEARTLGLTQICPRANVVTAELVQRLHAEGLVVRAWGVPNEDDASGRDGGRQRHDGELPGRAAHVSCRSPSLEEMTWRSDWS